MPSLDFKGKTFVDSHHLTVPLRELVVEEKKSCPPKGKKPSLDDNLGNVRFDERSSPCLN